MITNPTDPAKVEELKTLVKSGLTIAAAAARAGIARSTAGYILQRIGVCRPGGKGTHSRPVEPCARCGTVRGYVPPNQVRPFRRRASRFGLKGVLCNGCYGFHLAQEKSAGRGRHTAVQRELSLDGWERRRAIVHTDVMSAGEGFEPEDRDPLKAPWRAVATPTVDVAELEREARRKAVARLCRAWREGPAAVLALVFGRQTTEVA